jgi:Ran GTPase-activating protein (RanGAP) involved in mRNA processing and transport
MEVDLAQNEISDEGAQHLAHAFENNTASQILLYSFLLHLHFFLIQSLTTLNLSSNGIGAEGAQHLAHTFKNNKVGLIFFFFFAFSLSYLDTH